MQPTKEQIENAILSLNEEIKKIKEEKERLCVKTEKVKKVLEKKNLLILALENLKRAG